jgi:hypothetical protein
MSAIKQHFILGKNKNELKACLMILENNKKEGEEFLYYSFVTNEKCNNLLNLKGVILASADISHCILKDDFKISTIYDSENKRNYKISTRLFNKNYIISIILPAICPDNIVKYACNEFIEFLNIFFEKFEETAKFTDVLNKYIEILLFNITNFSLQFDKEDHISTPLTIMPIINITFSYNEENPCFLIKPPINDNLRTELIEVLNTLNSDRSVLQETLTIMDPPFFIRGFTVLFNGFVIYNTLSNKEMVSITRLAILHEVYLRSKSSHEVLSCEFLFENDDYDNPSRTLLNYDERKKILVTLLAQREFTILISMDILGKNNSSFDPFYNKRVEDLLISLLKKGYNSIINNELNYNSIKMLEEVNQQEEKVFNDAESEFSRSSKKDNTILSRFEMERMERANDFNVDYFKSKIKGYIDVETKVNIIHFSCYDDTECIINTTDLNVTYEIYLEIYRSIFIEYAKIQSNINKLKQRSKLLKLRNIYNYENIEKQYTNLLNKENIIKTKSQREKFLKSLKIFKINEYGYKLKVDNVIPIWVCCKIYEHTTIEDEANLEEFSNYKIIFVSYESHSPVDIDGFCQDLIINELFI